MLPRPRMSVRLSIASYVRSTMGPASGRVRVTQSLTLHLGLFHQRYPFRGVGVDEAREVVRRSGRRRLVARARQALAQLGVVEAALQGGIELSDDNRRCCLGPDEAVPSDHRKPSGSGLPG